MHFKLIAYAITNDVDVQTKMLNDARHLADANDGLLLLMLLVVMRVRHMTMRCFI